MCVLSLSIFISSMNDLRILDDDDQIIKIGKFQSAARGLISEEDKRQWRCKTLDDDDQIIKIGNKISEEDKGQWRCKRRKIKESERQRHICDVDNLRYTLYTQYYKLYTVYFILVIVYCILYYKVHRHCTADIYITYCVQCVLLRLCELQAMVIEQCVSLWTVCYHQCYYYCQIVSQSVDSVLPTLLHSVWIVCQSADSVLVFYKQKWQQVQRILVSRS